MAGAPNADRQRADATGYRVSIASSVDDVRATWRHLQSSGQAYGFQSLEWIDAWSGTMGASAGLEPRIVLVEAPPGTPVMLLPLAVSRGRFLNRLVWLGGALADYQGPVLGPRFADSAVPLRFKEIWQDVCARLPEVHTIVLDKLPATIGSERNPFAQLAWQRHSSAAHFTELTADYDTFIAARRSAKSLASDRRKERHLSKSGDLRFVVADSPEVRRELLAELFRQKSAGYRALGVADLFAESAYRDFVTRLATDSPSRILLCALTVGDRVVATCFSLVYNGRLYYLLPAYERNELSRFGPGNALLYRMFRWCFDNGVRVFDFTLGDEPYKRFWSDHTLELYDLVHGIGLLGRCDAACLRLARRMKRCIKGSPRLFRLLLELRRFGSRHIERAKSV